MSAMKFSSFEGSCSHSTTMRLWCLMQGETAAHITYKSVYRLPSIGKVSPGSTMRRPRVSFQLPYAIDFLAHYHRIYQFNDLDILLMCKRRLVHWNNLQEGEPCIPLRRPRSHRYSETNKPLLLKNIRRRRLPDLVVLGLVFNDGGDVPQLFVQVFFQSLQ